MRIDKVWSVITMLMTSWKSDLFDKIKREFFQIVSEYVQLLQQLNFK